MELVENRSWWIGPNGERYRVIAGGVDESDAAVEETPPPETPPAETPPPPDPAAEAARLREENARLRGENTALRETRREPPPAAPPTPPDDPIAAEYEEIQKDFAAGKFSDDERTFRLGRLGTKAELARRDADERATQVRQRDDQARTQSGQKIAVYLEKHPGLADASGPEMQRVLPHLRAVTEEFGFAATDPRAQVLALERAYGPINRSAHVDTREFERRRHPGGGGGGTFGEEPPAPVKPPSHGERLFNRLLPEYQRFYLDTRGSKEAAIKTLEHADEHQMRKQGRFREGAAT